MSGRCMTRDFDRVEDCGKPAYASHRCMEHWLEHVRGIYTRLADARARVADEEQALECALVSQQAQCEARDSLGKSREP